MRYFVASTRSCFVVLLIWAIYLLSSAPETKAAAWEQQLASYKLDNGHLIEHQLDIGLVGQGIRVHPVETDVRIHQYVWDVVRYIFPPVMFEDIGFVVFYTDGYSGSHGLLTTDSKSKNFVIGIDIRDILRRRKDGKIVLNEIELAQTLTHELFHSLSLSERQVQHRHEWSELRNRQNRVAKQIRSCPAGSYTRVGCAKEKSYISEFMKGFWGKDLNRWYSALVAEPERGQVVGMFRAGKYVNSYAATDPQEDLAESFSSFVFSDKINVKSLAGKKIYFFAGYPELRFIRKHVRKRLAALQNGQSHRLAFSVKGLD